MFSNEGLSPVEPMSVPAEVERVIREAKLQIVGTQPAKNGKRIIVSAAGKKDDKRMSFVLGQEQSRRWKNALQAFARRVQRHQNMRPGREERKKTTAHYRAVCDSISTICLVGVQKNDDGVRCVVVAYPNRPEERLRINVPPGEKFGAYELRSALGMPTP